MHIACPRYQLVTDSIYKTTHLSNTVKIAFSEPLPTKAAGGGTALFNSPGLITKQKHPSWLGAFVWQTQSRQVKNLSGFGEGSLLYFD